MNKLVSFASLSILLVGGTFLFQNCMPSYVAKLADFSVGQSSTDTAIPSMKIQNLGTYMRDPSLKYAKTPGAPLIPMIGFGYSKIIIALTTGLSVVHTSDMSRVCGKLDFSLPQDSYSLVGGGDAYVIRSPGDTKAVFVDVRDPGTPMLIGVPIPAANKGFAQSDISSAFRFGDDMTSDCFSSVPGVECTTSNDQTTQIDITAIEGVNTAGLQAMALGASTSGDFYALLFDPAGVRPTQLAVYKTALRSSFLSGVVISPLVDVPRGPISVAHVNKGKLILFNGTKISLIDIRDPRKPVFAASADVVDAPLEQRFWGDELVLNYTDRVTAYRFVNLSN